MIVIEKDGNGFFDLTLFDKSMSIVGVLYDFIFVNDTTREELEFTLTDISDFPERFSRFEYVDTMFQDSTPGFWKYKVKNDDVEIAFGRMILSTTPGSFIQYDGKDNSVYVYSK